jgi:hypothetical protein
MVMVFYIFIDIIIESKRKGRGGSNFLRFSLDFPGSTDGGQRRLGFVIDSWVVE